MASVTGGRSGPITVQSLIVINGVVDPNIVLNRQRMADVAGPDATVIGRSAIGPSQLKIEEQELLLMPVTGFNYAGQTATARRPLVFSSFNGIPVDKNMSQDAFEDEYVWLGMAHTVTAPEGDPVGMASGISIKRGGSGTTFNNSTDTFCPGDIIGYRLPSVDEATRDREVNMFAWRTGERSRPMKHTAMLRKITYEEITTQFDKAVARLLTDVQTVNVIEREQAGASGMFRPVDGIEEMAVLLKKAYGWAFVAAIATAMDRNVVVWNGTPTSKQEQIAQLGAMMGLVNKVSGAREDTKMQEDFFKRALHASLGSLDDKFQKSAVDLVRSDLFAATQLAPVFGQVGKRDSPDTNLHAIAKTASNDLTKMYGQCMTRYERKTIGTSSTYSPPGTNLDYILRP
jgi:hypothetical protein